MWKITYKNTFKHINPDKNLIFPRFNTAFFQVADYLELLARMHRLDPELRAAELYVCTAPLMTLGRLGWEVFMDIWGFSWGFSMIFMDFHEIFFQIFLARNEETGIFG